MNSDDTSNVDFVGKLDDYNKDSFASEVIDKLQKQFPDLLFEIYLGFPIYIDEVSKHQTILDLTIICKRGVFIFNIINEDIINYGELQDEIYSKVSSKFFKQKFLVKKHSLIFNFHVATISLKQINADSEYSILFTSNDVVDYIQSNMENKEFSDDLCRKITVALQESYGLNTWVERVNAKAGSKAESINRLSGLIEKYDVKQMNAILDDPIGVQRIRGMAGSGKTVILARKAVELHTKHPDWDIVVTYYTRSIRDQLYELIQKFYSIKNDGASYNKDKLRIMQAWGSSGSHGIYYEIASKHGIRPLNLNDAKTKFKSNSQLFPQVCNELMNEIKTFNKMFDCILIDEAQDFDKSFLRLCYKTTGPEHRLVYAYDELQKLDNDAMPEPKVIFGKDVKSDTPLKVCYRNQGAAIVTAHAIGMGLYRDQGLVQLPASTSVWESIGYLSDNQIKEGNQVELYRTKDTSPDYLNINNEDVINFKSFINNKEMYEELLDSINNDICKEQLLPTDILVIDMATLSYMNNFNILKNLQLKYKSKYNNLNFHTAGAANPEDFFRSDSIVYSSVLRAKGNETFMVYIVNAQNYYSSLEPRSERNALFSAITRSKGWINVFGYGEGMDRLMNEFNKIKEHDFKLFFEEYPDKEKQKEIFINNRDVTKEEKSEISNAKAMIDKLINTEKISRENLIKELFNIRDDELNNLN